MGFPQSLHPIAALLATLELDDQLLLTILLWTKLLFVLVGNIRCDMAVGYYLLLNVEQDSSIKSINNNISHF
jgi:hypothetical protein